MFYHMYIAPQIRMGTLLCFMQISQVKHISRKRSQITLCTTYDRYNGIDNEIACVTEGSS